MSPAFVPVRNDGEGERSRTGRPQHAEGKAHFRFGFEIAVLPDETVAVARFFLFNCQIALESVRLTCDAVQTDQFSESGTGASLPLFDFIRAAPMKGELPLLRGVDTIEIKSNIVGVSFLLCFIHFACSDFSGEDAIVSNSICISKRST
jgi:hypothetical protein